MTPGSDAQAPLSLRDVFALRDVRQAILRRLWVVLLVVLVFLGATLGVTLWQTPVYEASAKLVVGQKPGVTQDPDVSKNVEGLQLILPSVVEAMVSRPVAEEVIQRLGLKGMKPAELLENLSVEQEGSTVFIQLSYKDADPERAQQIVNTVGVVSSERIPEAIGNADITVTMYEDALVPGSPASPDPLRNGILALLLGLMLGTGLALLTEYMDDRLRSPEKVEQITGIPSFGAVPDFGLTKDKKKKGY
jgi:capsular polysaccharide biosynthesis protein